MKIGLCGTFSVGKTTLVKELSKLPQFNNYYIATERSKYLRDLGVKLNTDSTVLGQFLFAGERSAELLNENLITDRTIYDVIAFTLSSKEIDFEDKHTLCKAFKLIKDNYDIVIYVDPEGVEIEDNGVRETNSEYRNQIDSSIKTLLLKYPPKKLIKIKGDTSQRIKTILENI